MFYQSFFSHKWNDAQLLLMHMVYKITRKPGFGDQSHGHLISLTHRSWKGPCTTAAKESASQTKGGPQLPICPARRGPPPATNGAQTTQAPVGETLSINSAERRLVEVDITWPILFCYQDIGKNLIIS